MPRPVIALLTDFGLHDHYVGVMKAVMLGIAREAAFIDITHDIAPQDIVAGALELEAVVSYLPVGTVLVGVVDPGVGSERRGIAVEAGGLTLVGPDNGLFTLALNRLGQGRAVELRESRFALPGASLTFEGRDRFAPAAAYLASGVDLAAFGPSADRLVAVDVPEPFVSADLIVGTVVRIDRFGNLITNIPRTAVPLDGRGCRVEVGELRLDGIVPTYAASRAGAVCALFGSTDRLEIAVNGGSAARRLGVARGMPVQVRCPDGA